jgi:thiol:disulfide interchange protein
MINHLWHVLYALTFLWICAMGFTAFGRMPDKVRGGMATRLMIYGVILCGLAVAITQAGMLAATTHAGRARAACARGTRGTQRNRGYPVHAHRVHVPGHVPRR